MANRWKDWLAQAERDLEQAADSARAGRHEWACFAAHQAAEKAVKSVHLRYHQEAWGHVVAQLLSDLPGEIAPDVELFDKARMLDGLYLPTRYPNGHPAGAPFEHYGVLQSETAIKYATEILDFARASLA